MRIESRISNVNPDKATGKVREIFDEILAVRGQKKGGDEFYSGINMVVRTYALAPQVLERFWFSNAKAIRSGKLSHRFKQSIAFTVSKAWGCDS